MEKDIYAEARKILPDDFFNDIKPKDIVKSKDDYDIPFEWSEDVLNGKKEAILVLDEHPKHKVPKNCLPFKIIEVDKK